MLAEELRALDYSQRLRDRSRSGLAKAHKSTGRVLFEGATKGDAHVAARDSATDTALDASMCAGDDRMVSNLWSAGRNSSKMDSILRLR